MRKQGYKESTIQPRIRALKAISRRANLLDPESVKSYLASAALSESRKEKLTNHDIRAITTISLNMKPIPS
jgi:hypothetical protein